MKKYLYFLSILIFCSTTTLYALPTAPLYLITLWVGNGSPKHEGNTVTYSTRARDSEVTRSTMCVQSDHTGQLTFTRNVPSYDASISAYEGTNVSENDIVLTSYFKIKPTQLASSATDDEKVSLNIDMQTASNTHTNSQQQFKTTLTASLDRWTLISGNADRQKNTTTYETDSRSLGIVNYYVRVEKVDDCSE